MRLATAIFALVIGIGAAGLGRRAAENARAALESASLRRDTLAVEVRTWRGRAAAAKAVPAPAPKAPAAAAKETALQANDPKVHAAYLQFFGARLHYQRRFVYRELGLTPPQIEKLEALESAHEEDRLDRAAAAEAQGLSPKDPGVTAMQKQADTQLAVDEAGLVGQAGYQQLQQADRGKPAENLGDDVSRLVSYGGTPLTLDQGEHLMNAVLAASSSYQSGGTPNPESEDRGTLLAQARIFLTPAQFTALQSETELVPIMTLVKQFYGR